MAFTPADKLTNKTFVGLIIAQFLAGFMDQAIHASAMFYAIHQGALTESEAITLMPILFYAPWAIFCTISGYLADRFSKTNALIIWKFAEVVIACVALYGFYLGSVKHDPLGAKLVLSCVFLMGTHAAFFAPAKYGAMPEILQPHILSKGNGILESTTFLAAILGTVTGGFLSKIFHGQEYWIGIVLVVLAIVGSIASMLIAKLPAANPTRLFPVNLFKPLWENLKEIFQSKPLALSALGIAFFVFMVAYMRQCMYMHGETRVPRWDELHTSLVVAAVALGVGIGSPLAGYLSGGKIELGLVPLGCFGMMLASFFAAATIHQEWALIVSLIIIGFFSGFYMVPLYTLFQHRAPKKSKGDLVATSNFINVTGAIAASLLFKLLVSIGQMSQLTPTVPQEDNYLFGTLKKLEYDTNTGRPSLLQVESTSDKTTKVFAQKGFKGVQRTVLDDPETDIFDPGYFETIGSGNAFENQDVIVSRYKLRGQTHYRVRLASQPLRPVYDNDGLPGYLFVGAALMTFGILCLLVRQLPDFFVRTAFWYRSLRRFKIKAVGMQNLPTSGAVLLATNANQLEKGLQLVSATDRYTSLLLPESASKEGGSILRYLAQRSFVGATPEKMIESLKEGHLLAASIDTQILGTSLKEICEKANAKLVPVYCGPLDGEVTATGSQPIRVVFGEALPPETPLADVRGRIKQLGDWIRENDHLSDKH